MNEVKLGNLVKVVSGDMQGAAGVVMKIEADIATVEMHGVVNGVEVNGGYQIDVAELEVLPNV